jgi:hypothetical protein
MAYVSRPFVGDSSSPSDALLWIHNELLRVEAAFASPEVDHVRFKVLHEEPAHVFEGLVVIADGTNWDPGSGYGLYRYTGSATWDFVG